MQRLRTSQRLTGAALAALLLLAGCSKSEPGGASKSTTTATAGAATTSTTAPAGAGQPRFPGADWVVEDPGVQGIDKAGLDRAADYAFTKGANTKGFVVVHKGAIIAERYAEGSDATSWAASWSMAKSVTSALVGIAIDEGKIPGVDEPMTKWYPQWRGTKLADVKLRDVLQMSTGQKWNEDYNPNNGPSDIIEMVATKADQLEFALSRPYERPAGTEFHYSSGTSMLMSGMLAQATGMRADEYARTKLFEPIGMSKVDWWRDAADHTLTYCCVDTTSRDFARIGLLYLHGGRWKDRQVVPESWVRESLTPSPSSDGAYGYQWWLDDVDGVPHDLFTAQGFDGQYIFVVPSLDLVVVRNGTYVKDPGPPVAKPNLFSVYPPSGFVKGKGTQPPSVPWEGREMLRLVVKAVEGGR